MHLRNKPDSLVSCYWLNNYLSLSPSTTKKQNRLFLSVVIVIFHTNLYIVDCPRMTVGIAAIRRCYTLWSCSPIKITPCFSMIQDINSIIVITGFVAINDSDCNLFSSSFRLGFHLCSLFPFNWNNPAANVWLVGEGAFVRCQVDELI